MYVKLTDISVLQFIYCMMLVILLLLTETVSKISCISCKVIIVVSMLMSFKIILRSFGKVSFSSW
jgi:hypothetical protein